MKKILVFIFALLMCFSFTSCKDKAQTSGTDISDGSTQISSTELTIRTLVEQNLDCYFLFYVDPLPHTTQQNSDGYYGTETTYLKSYSELENKVNSTYVSDTAEKLLTYPNKNTPLYKNVNDKIFVKPDVITKTQYAIIWDGTYDVEIVKQTDTDCTFKLTTTDLDSKPYEVQGSITLQDDQWLLQDLVY